MKKILILGVASVQMDAIINLKNNGYEVHACAMSNDGPGAEVADYFEVINILDLEKVKEYIIKNEIDAVYSVGSDLAMPIISKISEQLNLNKFVSEETATICNNKNLMREFLGEDFEGNIKFQIIKDKNEFVNIQYPFIMKPCDSQGQRGVKLIKNQKQFISNFDESKKYSRSGLVILEQYISGPELSVNGYIVNGNIEYLIESDRETWNEYTGLIHKHVVPSINSDKEICKKIKSVVANACNKLNINNGPVYLQMKLEKGIPYIIEITPRLDGCHMWKLLKYFSNIDLLKLTFEHLLENNVSELEKIKFDNKQYILEFICKEPNTLAEYKKEFYEKKLLDKFNYYKDGDNIRAINGKFEKIGYVIY